jgi:hypothetical protein
MTWTMLGEGPASAAARDASGPDIARLVMSCQDRPGIGASVASFLRRTAQL